MVFHVLPVIFVPKKPAPSSSKLVNIMKELNYQDDSLLMHNLYENTRDVGYVKTVFIPTAFFMVFGFLSGPTLLLPDKEEQKESTTDVTA